MKIQDKDCLSPEARATVLKAIREAQAQLARAARYMKDDTDLSDKVNAARVALSSIETY